MGECASDRAGDRAGERAGDRAGDCAGENALECAGGSAGESAKGENLTRYWLAVFRNLGMKVKYEKRYLHAKRKPGVRRA